MWELLTFGTIALCLIALWVQQFAELMRLPDSAFPGRNDKVLWTVAFIVMPWLVPITFLAWGGSNYHSGSIGREP